ncbi:MAG: photosystem II biogenesis protein Psp29, partial [Leptolyngbyaceae cyanobacterium CRU_2_3]|nr:photosystem II biogenesis protein Psp29 [Leptolyngbyaceae cyanobacterium CRU_2_3]
MSTVRTVSDTKRAFYTLHTRPINSIYRRVVDELMVEMHLLSVNADFSYNPIYRLGVVTAFDRFMQGYRPEEDINSIFNALCQALQEDPQQYRQEAEQIRSEATAYTVQRLFWQSLSSLAPQTHL